MIQLVWLIPLIMLLAALINGLGVRKLGRFAGHIAWISMAVCCLISIGILLQVMGLAGDGHWHGTKISLWTWFNIHNVFGSNRTMSIDMAFFVDQLTAVFLFFVSFIGLLVFIYATGYMKEKHHGKLELDPGYARFFSYVCLFAASMFILVLGENLAVMFIGWEGVGLCSYLLIGYFFDKRFSENLTCADAGRKAFVVNRIGDAGLIVGMGLMFWGLGTVSFQEINEVLTSGALLNGDPLPEGFLMGGALITAATLCMFLGATGKSAQIPLFTWLPDAMAGPTPVSALIHAATMVTAGVYMVARLNVAYFFSPTTLTVIAVIGALTAFAAATMAITQRGIKKVLAYSTVSQLGYMFLGLGVGNMAAGIFHVFTHAFFKGCLFLAAGAVIHAMHHEEDMYKMGGLKKYMPKTAFAYGAATLCIAGFPLTSGFFSKDEIIFSSFVRFGGVNILFLIAMVTAILTAIYMGRSFFLTFWGRDNRIDEHTKEHLHEAPVNMWAPVMTLAVIALFVGFLNVPSGLKFIPVPKAEFHHFLAPVVDQGAEYVYAMETGKTIDHAAGESVYGHKVLASGGTEAKLTQSDYGAEVALALISGLLAIIGLGIAWFFFRDGVSQGARSTARVLRPLWLMSWNTWWWDAAYNKFIQGGTMKAADGVLTTDRELVDGAVNGLGDLCNEAGEGLRRLQNGRVQAYGLVMFLGVCAFVIYLMFGMSEFLREAFSPAAEETPAAATAPPPADGTASATTAPGTIVAAAEETFN